MCPNSYLELGGLPDCEEVEKARHEVGVNYMLNRGVSLLREESPEANSGEDDLSFICLVDQMVQLLEIGLLQTF